MFKATKIKKSAKWSPTFRLFFWWSLFFHTLGFSWLLPLFHSWSTVFGKAVKICPCHETGLPFYILTLPNAFLLPSLKYAVKKNFWTGVSISDPWEGKKKKENFRYLENGKEHEEIKQHRFPWQKRNSLPAITSIAQMGRGGGEWRTASYRTFLPLLCGFLLINGALPAATNILHLYSLPDSKPSTFF